GGVEICGGRSSNEDRFRHAMLQLLFHKRASPLWGGRKGLRQKNKRQFPPPRGALVFSIHYVDSTNSSAACDRAIIHPEPAGKREICRRPPQAEAEPFTPLFLLLASRGAPRDAKIPKTHQSSSRMRAASLTPSARRRASRLTTR